MSVDRIVVVTGPPCSGKTTHVRDHRADGDVVVDLDALAHALGYPTEQVDWSVPHVARLLRRSLIDDALTGQLGDAWSADLDPVTVWIVDAAPGPVARRYYRDAEVEWVNLDPGLDACLERAARRANVDATSEQILEWYAARTERPTPSGSRRRSL